MRRPYVAELPLVDEVLTEVPLQGRAEHPVIRCTNSRFAVKRVPHGLLSTTAANLSNLAPAMESSSPVPLKYQ